MASQVLTGSPKLGRRQTPSTKHLDDSREQDRTPKDTNRVASSTSTTPLPANFKSDGSGSQVRVPRATTSSYSNQFTKMVEGANLESTHNVSDILAQLHINDGRKPSFIQTTKHKTLDKLTVGMRDQHKVSMKQPADVNDSDTASYREQDRSSGSDLFTPATENFESDIHNVSNKMIVHDTAEMSRIKQELEAAKSVINRQELELAESRNLRHTMEQAMGPASEIDFQLHNGPARVPTGPNQSNFNASARPFTSRTGTEPDWQLVDDGKADIATTLVNSGPVRGRTWNTLNTGYQAIPYGPNREARTNSLNYGTNYVPQPSILETNIPPHRTFSSGSSNVSYGIDERLLGGIGQGVSAIGPRRPSVMLRSGSTINDPLSPISPVNSYAHTLVEPGAFANMAGPGQFGCLERGFNGQTSPMASSFQTGTGQMFAADLGLAGCGLNNPSYVMPAEPMNYRRLLDKSVSCDWKYIVDKIVCNNDQQASIFLQQKLKVGTAEQKFDIVESIVNQAYPLMINRFGNFLVQRCFEHGTPDQVVAIANAIHGNVISLSMDPFGCHVIQKAFDSIPEDHKADMVRELLRRIPDTVIHRYACHVWQKLFELRWSGEPPQIMVKVNEALRGMWHEVALGETGSLVVQNIFENCVEEEKRPAIEEVIANIDLISHGQFGNWCIQHLCEHGSPPDKRRVIDHILASAYNYSIDQFASKVVEKCLKIGGSEFLERYLGAITTARPDRPRIPLIDIAGDQYGNYLVQWILVNTHQHQREQVAVHIRKHMVSLRGSKFGSRVAMLCSNPASVTRPGPASALVNPYGAPAQQRIGGRYR